MRKLILLLLMTITSLSLVACGGDTKNSKDKGPDQEKDVYVDNSWTKIKEKGELIVGNCPEYPPFSFKNEKNEIEGFDSDFGKALGESLGVKVTVKDTAWEGLVAGLQKGDHDVIISCMSPEEATAASDSVSMSKPYYQLSEIIVTKSNNNSIKSKEDLAGKIVGVQANCTSEVAVDSLKDMNIDAKEIKRYNRNSEALADLKNGRVEAVVVGFAYAATQVKENTDLRVINDPIKSVDVVVVTSKGADELTSKINEAIDKVKSDGSFDKAYKKWLEIE